MYSPRLFRVFWPLLKSKVKFPIQSPKLGSRSPLTSGHLMEDALISSPSFDTVDKCKYKKIFSTEDI